MVVSIRLMKGCSEAPPEVAPAPCFEMRGMPFHEEQKINARRTCANAAHCITMPIHFNKPGHD